MLAVQQQATKTNQLHGQIRHRQKLRCKTPTIVFHQVGTMYKKPIKNKRCFLALPAAATSEAEQQP